MAECGRARPGLRSRWPPAGPRSVAPQQHAPSSPRSAAAARAAPSSTHRTASSLQTTVVAPRVAQDLPPAGGPVGPRFAGLKVAPSQGWPAQTSRYSEPLRNTTPAAPLRHGSAGHLGRASNSPVVASVRRRSGGRAGPISRERVASTHRPPSPGRPGARAAVCAHHIGRSDRVRAARDPAWRSIAAFTSMDRGRTRRGQRSVSIDPLSGDPHRGSTSQPPLALVSASLIVRIVSATSPSPSEAWPPLCASPPPAPAACTAPASPRRLPARAGRRILSEARGAG